MIHLITIIVEDLYPKQLKEGYEFLQDYIEMTKLVEMELITRFKVKEITEKLPYV